MNRLKKKNNNRDIKKLHLENSYLKQQLKIEKDHIEKLKQKLTKNQENLEYQKEREEKLYQSKEELLYITNSLPVGVSYIDNQRRYRFLNTMQEKWINGLRNGLKQDILDKYIWEILGEEFYEEFAKVLIDKVFEGEEVFYERTIYFNPEEAKNVEGRLVPDFDKNGEFKGYFCIITDITQRKQDSLKIQEQLTTIEATIDGICVFKNDELTYANQSLLTIFGYDNEKDILGKSWSIFYPDSEIKRLKNYILPTLKNNKSWQGETIGIKKNGTTFYEEISLTLLEDNTIIAICRDISDRKKVEELLRIAEENYRSIFHNALEGIFQSTPEGYYLNVNPAMAKIHGYNSPEEMIINVKHINQQIHINNQRREKFKLLRENQDYIKNFEYQVYHQDGQIIWLQENTRRVCDNNGKILYYEGIVQDITEQKFKEKMLKKQIEELKISIDQDKRKQEVNSIAESDYFKELKANVSQLRISH